MAIDWKETFDEEITDFDAISPAWDGEVDAVADFDAETDVDGDLNDHADAAHDGPVGLEITFDNATAAYGTMNADAIDQTSGWITFWFDKHDVAIEVAAGKIIYLLQALNGAAQYSYNVYLHNNGQLYFQYRDDAAAVHLAGTFVAGDGYHRYDLAFKRSTGAGNDDGWLRVYQDGVLKINSTGHDNDTRDWDYIRAGMLYTNSTTFGGSFYLDTIKIDPVGAPMVDTLAVREGTYGMMIPIMDTTARYGEFTDPANESEVTLEGWLTPSPITMAEGDVFMCMEGRGSGAIATSVGVNLGYRDSAYELSLLMYDDSSILLTSEPITITDNWHRIRVVWKAATGVGENDGRAYLYIDDGIAIRIEEIDNDGYDVDTIRVGAVSGLDAGTTGIIFLDQCRWSDDTVMIITAESGKGQFVAKSTLRTNSTLVSEIYDADRLAGDIVFDIARLGDATYKRYLIYMFDDRELIYDQAAQPERG